MNYLYVYGAALAVILMAYAAVFQYPDGIQALSAGALRGLKDTRIPMFITVLAYWGLGLPLGAWFGLHLDGRAPGLWVVGPQTRLAGDAVGRTGRRLELAILHAEVRRGRPRKRTELRRHNDQHRQQNQRNHKAHENLSPARAHAASPA